MRIPITALCVLLLCQIPATAQKVWKIMPVGNSITAGVGGSNGYGYRDDLSTKLKSAGISFELVGPDGTPYNGHFLSGAKIEDFMPGGSKDISGSLMTYQPNILLLHLGTNNMSHDVAPYSNNRGITYESTASGLLASFLSYLKQYANGTRASFLERVLVCKIIPKYSNGASETNVDLYNAEIERMFFENPPFAKMTVVDMNSILALSDYADDRHPNDGGYAKMAAEYANVINGVIRTDTSSPGDPGSLVAQAIDAQTAGLGWMAGGDDGSSGRANLYELRYATFQLTDKNYSQGKLVSLKRPSSAGTTESKSVDHLVSGLTYYFGLRSYDEWNNRSAVRFFAPVLIEGTPGYRYCDDFSDATIPNWKVNPYFEMNIVNQDIRLKSSAPAVWDYLATFTGARYNSQAKSVRASMRWSVLADKNGMNASGVAMMLDKADYNANGYLVRLRNGVLYLNQIRGGALLASEIQRYTSTATDLTPMPGDSLIVRYFPGGVYGHVFDVYLNKTYVGQVYDKGKLEGNGSQLYSGFMAYGGGVANAVTNYCLEIPPLTADSMQTFVGNQQRGQITQRLAEPLTVKVLDANGIPVSDVQVEFRIKSGQAMLSTDSLANNFNGNLWMEAEKGELTGPYISGSTVEASNSEFIYVPSDVDREKGLAKYQLYNVKAGQYRLWLRVNALDGSHNSCFISVNGSDTLQFDFTNNLGKFVWYPYNSRTFYLPQGFFNFAIKNRESNTRIDKILLTSNTSYTPDGTGSVTQRFSNLTDYGGLAYAFITFTTVSGAVQVDASAPQVPNGSPQVFTVYADALNPQSMVYASERVLSDTVGQMMSEAFAVKMKDSYGNNCTGVAVEFSVMEGDGVFGNSSAIRVTSNSQGVASAQLKLGYSLTGSKVQARLVDFADIGTLTFEAVPDKEGVPMEIVAIKGNNQMGVVHTALKDSLIVQVLDRNGRPVHKYPVPFKIAKGNGSFNGLGKAFIDSTNIYGKAHARFVLGDSAGTDNNVVSIDVPLNGAPILFKASALPDEPSLFKLIDGDKQEWYAGETFEKPLVVKLTDRYGNGRQNYPVKFTVLPEYGNGHFSNSRDTLTVATDTLGLARAYYTAGKQTGVNQIRAEVPSSLRISPVLFSYLLVKPPKPNRILEVSGNYQEGTVNEALTQPLKVKVIDPFNNAMSDVVLVFKVSEGGGKISGSDSLLVRTDSNGQADVTFQLGKQAGYTNQHVVVYAAEYALQAVEFAASGLPGSASRLQAVSDLNFSEKAEAVAPLQVQVRDAFSNPKSGQTVKFQITEGNGHFESGVTSVEVITNQSGIALVQYYMGTRSDVANLIVASSFNSNNAPLLDSPLTFVGRAIAGSPSQLVMLNEDNPSGQVLSILSEPFKVQVRDVFGNAVQQGVMVTFTVVEGGGTIENETTIDEPTDVNGQALIFLKLGRQAGINNNKVTAGLRDLPKVKTVTFSASALAESPHRIYVDGDSVFTGKVKSEFNPRVHVTDIYGNRIRDFSVLFKVTRGGGKLKSAETVQWLDSVRVHTDLEGKATVRWQFGGTPDSNAVLAYGSWNGQAITSSPIPFRGYATPEDAQYLVRVSAETDTGVVRNSLAEPLVVKVTDRSGNLVPNHPVLFEVIYPSAADGQGKLYTVASMGDTSAQKTILTNQQGRAQVYFLLSKRPGPNYIKATSRFVGSSNFLFGSPINFHIEGLASPAKKLVLLSPSAISARVRSSQSVRVQTLDAFGKAVANQPVQFKVMDEESQLIGSDTHWITVNTDNNGTAGATWILGRKAGLNNNALQISSTPLENSPITVQASAQTGPADMTVSTIATVLDSVPADNLAQARVTVTVTDSFKNAVSGVNVTWQTNDSGLSFDDVADITDGSGKASVLVRSVQAGVKTVAARITTESPFTLCCASITFLPGQAAKLRIYNGNGQVANVGTQVKDSLAVQVLDANNNPVPGAAVRFAVHTGGGFFLPSMQAVCSDTSNSDGVARAHLVLGQQVNPNLDNVVVASIGTIEAVFICKTKAATPAYIYAYQYQPLQGTVLTTLAQPLQVLIEDSNGDPVWNAAVTFAPSDTDGVIVSPQPVLSDYRGIAQAYYRLGRKAGERLVTALLPGTQKSVTYLVRAVGKEPSNIAVLSGNNQQGTVGQRLAQPLRVALRDEFGNGVANAMVIFKSVEGYASQIVGPDTVMTDVQGDVQVEMMLGRKAGDYTFAITSPLLYLQVATVTAKATAGTAYQLDRIPGHASNSTQSMTVGRETVFPVAAVVHDQYGNPAKNETVQFAVVENDGYVVNPKAVSDDSGRVFGRWVLGKQPGNNKCMAYRLGLMNSPLSFSAVGVTNNYPEFYDLPALNQTAEYNKLFTFTVHARDNDNDALRYSLRIKPNPSNAVFDSLNSQVFSWTPTVRQKGVYKLNLTVQDGKGGVDTDSLLVHVVGDSAPVITSLYPLCGLPLSLSLPDSMVFSCAAVDYDNDPLTFRWFVNGVPHEGSRFVFKSRDYSKGTKRIWVEVSDGTKTTRSCEWSLLTTQIELASFSAQVVAYEGVQLKWQTTLELDNVGFDVLRSDSEHGRFDRISGVVVAVRSDGDYTFIDSTAVAGVTYYYKIEDISSNGLRQQHGPVAAELALPETFSVLQNYPNPFNPETRIRFQLPAPGETRVAVFNTVGQLVRMLVNTSLPAGYHEIKWDGKDEQGRRVGSGVYYYRVQAGAEKSVRKMVMLK